MLHVTLAREKETKRTVRFIEIATDLDTQVGAPGREQLVGMVYIPKTTLGLLGEPEQITLTLEAAQVAELKAA